MPIFRGFLKSIFHVAQQFFLIIDYFPFSKGLELFIGWKFLEER